MLVAIKAKPTTTISKGQKNSKILKPTFKNNQAEFHPTSLLSILVAAFDRVKEGGFSSLL